MRARVWSTAKRSEEVDNLLDYAVDRLISSLCWSEANREIAEFDEGKASGLYFAAAQIAEVGIAYEGDWVTEGKWPTFQRWKSMIVEALLGSSLCPAPMERAA